MASLARVVASSAFGRGRGSATSLLTTSASAGNLPLVSPVLALARRWVSSTPAIGIAPTEVARAPNSIRAPTEVAPDLEDILANNRAWVAKQLAADPQFFEHLGSGQAPKYLWIGCADSRVPPNQIIDLPPGAVFLHRNLGNVVANTDLNCQSVIEFAVKHLKVEHIMVAGHYECGAVNASLQKQDLGLIEHWVRNIRDVHRHHAEEIRNAPDPFRRLVELNVVEQCINVFKSAAVQHRRLETSKSGEMTTPVVHGVVFDPATGVLKKLDINLEETMSKMKHIYDLYETTGDK